MDAVERLVDFWRGFCCAEFPYAHPEDESHVRETGFEFRLLPLPVVGDLAQADIIICMLNPGLDPADYSVVVRKDDIEMQIVV